MWPDFSAEDLEDAVKEFTRRERRFGGVPAGVVQSAWSGGKEPLPPR